MCRLLGVAVEGQTAHVLDSHMTILERAPKCEIVPQVLLSCLLGFWISTKGAVKCSWVSCIHSVGVLVLFLGSVY